MVLGIETTHLSLGDRGRCQEWECEHVHGGPVVVRHRSRVNMA